MFLKLRGAVECKAAHRKAEKVGKKWRKKCGKIKKMNGRVGNNNWEIERKKIIEVITQSRAVVFACIYISYKHLLRHWKKSLTRPH